uniref:Uncharacterized protein n=1 Tax=Clastoptera arizonana TaxID=38151 RepID=A0A1B6CAT5_9HEMI
MSYSGYKQSSPRTRGYPSRGYGGGSGYRGSSRGDSSNWRGGRGGYSSSNSRGRFTPNSYESRSRYSGLGVTDLYSAREDNSHRRYRDDSLYSGRDRSHRGDSPPRKRVRSDFSPVSF